MPPPAAEAWTTRRLLGWITEAFAKNDLDAPRLSAEILITHVIGAHTDRTGSAARLALYTDADRPASAEELDRLRGLVGRALRHEPIQYLTGEGWFFGLPFDVDRRVLIPRPSTETIVEHALQSLRPRGKPETTPQGDTVVDGVPTDEPAPREALSKRGTGAAVGTGLLLADVCTGSGCIAVSMLKNLPGAKAIGTDVSTDALEIARRNAVRHGVTERLELLEGDLLAPLATRIPAASEGGNGVDLLTANPPYIPDHEWAEVERNVKDHEPELALRGGRDGLAFVGPILRDGPALLKPGGLLLLEIAASTARAVFELAEQHPKLESCVVLSDIDGHPRVLAARRKP